MPPSKHFVFIVDDDADDRESIKDAFLQNQHNQNYVLMDKADELISYLQTASATTYPSLILLDLNMPGMDGRAVLKEIKSDKDLQHIPVVVLTTSSSMKDKQSAYKLGANCFITKPDSFNQFVNITDSIARLWLGSN